MKKSASKLKLAEDKKELPPIEDVFETQRKGMLATIDIQIKQDSRFDTLMAMRQSHERFFGEALTLGKARDLAARIKLQHQKVRGIIESMTLEQMTAEEFTNPCDALVDFEEPKEWEDVFEQSVFFAAVQPFGQAFDDLHGRMMEEAAHRA